MVDQSRGDAVQKSAVLVRFYTRKHIERPGSVKDQEYKANELAELKDRLASLEENTFYHGEALRYSSIKKFCKLIYGISSKENPRSIADKRKFYISDVIIDQLRQTEHEGNFEQYKQLDGIRKKEGLSNDQRCIYEYLEREIRAFKNEKGKDSENYIKNLPATAVESERFKDILLSLVVPANSIGDTEDKIDVLNVHFDPSDLESVSTLNNEYARQKLQRVQVILDQALTLFNMKNATRDLNSTNYRKHANAEIAPNTVFEVVNEELEAKTKELKKIHSQLIAQIGSFKNDIFSTDYRVFLKEPELVTQKIKQIDKFAPAMEMTLRDKVTLKQQQNLQSIYDLLAQEEVIQAEVAKTLYDFLAEENLNLTYSGVQVKSSPKGLEEHVAKSRSGVIVREQDLTDASLVRDLDGELPELIDSKLLLLEECYANLLYSTQDRQSLNLSTRNNRHTDSQDNKPKIRKRQAPVLRDAVAEQNSMETTISKVEQIKEASTNEEAQKNSHLQQTTEEDSNTLQPITSKSENDVTTEPLHSQTKVSVLNSANQSLPYIQDQPSSTLWDSNKFKEFCSNVDKTNPSFDVQYDMFFENIAVGSEHNREFHVDINCRRLYPQNYEYVTAFVNGLATGVNEEGVDIIDRNGQVLNDNPLSYKRISSFYEGKAVAVAENGYTYINQYGERVIPNFYSCANSFHNGKASVTTTEGKGIVINEKGERLFDIISSYRDDIAIASVNGLSYHIDKDYTPLYPQRYKRVQPFVGSYAKVESEDTVYVLNKQGEVVAKHPLKAPISKTETDTLKIGESKIKPEQPPIELISEDIRIKFSNEKSLNSLAPGIKKITENEPVLIEESGINLFVPFEKLENVSSEDAPSKKKASKNTSYDAPNESYSIKLTVIKRVEL